MRRCDDDAASPTPAVTPAYPPLPTAQELNGNLALAFDETVPLDQKIGLVEGANEDPDLVNKVAAAAKANDATVNVINVVDQGGGVAAADIEVIVRGGPPNPSTVQFVAEDGRWKLTRENACGFVALAQLSSPLCS